MSEDVHEILDNDEAYTQDFGQRETNIQRDVAELRAETLKTRVLSIDARQDTQTAGDLPSNACSPLG